MGSYSETIIDTRSEDGFFLEGLRLLPEAEPIAAAVVWVHGVYGAFYAPPGLGVGRALAARGVACVLANTRGHNVGAWLRRADGTMELAGGAWEKSAESVLDVSPWITVAAELSGRLMLAGHSLGARKVTHYLAERRDDRVNGLVLVSPSARQAEPDPDLRLAAERSTDEGHGVGLLPVSRDFAVSAQTYLDHFDPANPLLKAFVSPTSEPVIARVTTPILAVLGSLERTSVSECHAELELIGRNARRSPSFSVEVVQGANHIYAGTEATAASVIAAWITPR